VSVSVGDGAEESLDAADGFMASGEVVGTACDTVDGMVDKTVGGLAAGTDVGMADGAADGAMDGVQVADQRSWYWYS
jgi:hypothetical protein